MIKSHFSRFSCLFKYLKLAVFQAFSKNNIDELAIVAHLFVELAHKQSEETKDDSLTTAEQEIDEAIERLQKKMQAVSTNFELGHNHTSRLPKKMGKTKHGSGWGKVSC